MNDQIPENIQKQFDALAHDIKQHAKGHEHQPYVPYLNGALLHLDTARSFLRSFLTSVETEGQRLAQERTRQEQIRVMNREVQERIDEQQTLAAANQQALEAAQEHHPHP